MATYLVTGSGRGIGFELVRQLVARPSSIVEIVFATSRSDNAQLRHLVEQYPGRVMFIPLNVGDENSIRSAVSVVETALNGRGLDVLINNAGITSWINTEEMADLDELFHINVTGPHLMIQNFLPLLRRSTRKKVVNISSSVGSITLQPRYKKLPAASYKVTKAALNMLSTIWSQELEEEGFTILNQNPGWLKTDEANAHADLPVSVGVEQILHNAENMGQEGNGRFLNIHVPGWENAPGLHQYDGKDLPW